MLFTEFPDKFFPYTYIDLVHFPKGAADKQFIEKRFKGPVQRQMIQALGYIEANILHQLVTKVEGQAEAVRVWNYPFKALEEILANCIFHRNYQIREPVTIRIEQDAMIIYNSGGPDRFIRMEDFKTGRVFPKRYRNRRLGDFLKELDLTEGHATGVPVILEAMKRNGSPDPIFETDEGRNWFQITLPIHPAFTSDKIKIVSQSVADNNLSRLTNLVSSLVNNLVSSEQIFQDQAKILLFIGENTHKREEILNYIGLTNQTYNYRNYIEPLEKAELINKTIPEKPQSPKQKYFLTKKGKELLFTVTTEPS
jgi:ATP-dependent DNA helicase RecG